jgi:hypothetical protein
MDRAYREITLTGESLALKMREVREQREKTEAGE